MVVATTDSDGSKLNFNLGNLEQRKSKWKKEKQEEDESKEEDGEKKRQRKGSETERIKRWIETGEDDQDGWN